MTSSARGRVVIGVLGLDQHEVGALTVSQLLVRHGFEVVYVGRFQTPASLVGAAESEDAQIVGISVHSWEFTSYVDDLVARCRDAGVALVIGGSVLTGADAADLEARGVDAVFGPGAPSDDIVARCDELVAAHRQEEHA